MNYLISTNLDLALSRHRSNVLSGVGECFGWHVEECLELGSSFSESAAYTGRKESRQQDPNTFWLVLGVGGWASSYQLGPVGDGGDEKLDKDYGSIYIDTAAHK